MIQIDSCSCPPRTSCPHSAKWQVQICPNRDSFTLELFRIARNGNEKVTMNLKDYVAADFAHFTPEKLLELGQTLTQLAEAKLLQKAVAHEETP